MGFDVPMKKSNSTSSHNNTLTSEYSSSTLEMIKMYEELDIEDRAEIRGTIKGMLKAEKYTTTKSKLQA